jgi:hypothetical protein
MKGKQVHSSEDTQSAAKETVPEVNTDLILKRLEELEDRCTQLETTLETALKETVTFESLAAHLTDKKSKIRKRTRAKRELSPEEKTAFHARMVAGRLAKEKARKVSAKAEAKKK